MSSVPALDVRGLGKTFKQGWMKPPYEAIRDVTLTVHVGEVWAVAGPNGAGKTTMLHCIAGLLWPSAGSIQVLGSCPQSARARLGFQSEIFFTYPHLTCEEALHFYGRLSGIEGAPLQACVDRALDRVGLRSAAHRKIGGFSKGMIQRIGLAQSILHNPDLVIWDEPTTGLDPEGRALVFDMLADMRAQGKTVILSTHILDDIEKVCTHMAIIAAGRVQTAGAISELRGAHASKTLEQIYFEHVKGAVDGR